MSNQRLDSIEARLESLERKRDAVLSAEQELLNAARQYARLTTLEYALDDQGRRVIYCHRDAEDLAAFYQKNMAYFAKQILCAETT